MAIKAEAEAGADADADAGVDAGVDADAGADADPEDPPPARALTLDVSYYIFMRIAVFVSTLKTVSTSLLCGTPP